MGCLEHIQIQKEYVGPKPALIQQGNEEAHQRQHLCCRQEQIQGKHAGHSDKAFKFRQRIDLKAH